jgi:hypothetical protein
MNLPRFHQLGMRIQVIKGTISRRLLITFRADPKLVRGMLPEPFRPKLHHGYSILGICLIRLEHIRPAGVPELLGFSSENAAHRVAVEWKDSSGVMRDGVFIPRRDTGALLNRVAGGRIFPGEHHPARFLVSDDNGHIELTMESQDSVLVRVVGDETESLPATSCFDSLEEASAFFEGGSVGYSVSQDGQRLDGLILRTLDWHVSALSVTELYSNFFADQQLFPKDSMEFDHALIMRGLRHEWRRADDLYALPQVAVQA